MPTPLAIFESPQAVSVSSTAQDFTEINAANDANDDTFEITWE